MYFGTWQIYLGVLHVFYLMNSYKLELQFETSFLTNQEFTCSIGLGDYPQLKGGWQKGGILFFHKQDW